MNSEDVEEIAKQTLQSIEDVEMWVAHLDSVKKRRRAGAHKAAATKNRSQPDRSPVIRRPLLGMSSVVFVVVQSLVI